MAAQGPDWRTLESGRVGYFGFGGRAFVSALAHSLLQKYSLMCVLSLCMLTAPIMSSFPHFAHRLTIYAPDRNPSRGSKTFWSRAKRRGGPETGITARSVY